MPTLESTVPYPWPYDGCLDPARLALVICGAQAGWAARSTRAGEVASTLMNVASAFRTVGASVVFVRHGTSHRVRELAVPPATGEAPWQLAFAPNRSDLIVDAAGVDGFHGSALDDGLRARGRDHLVLGGFGYEAAVDSTMRSANDRGYECLVLDDAVAPFNEDLGERALASVTMSGGIFGAVGTSADLLHALMRTDSSLEAVP
jgi:nicotinamidase-related amidase